MKVIKCNYIVLRYHLYVNIFLNNFNATVEYSNVLKFVLSLFATSTFTLVSIMLNAYRE